MSLFNPYDDYKPSDKPSDESFWEIVLDIILDLGLGLWMFAFSPISLVVSGVAWFTWGGTLLMILTILGFGGCFLGMLLGGISLFRYIIWARSKDEPSALTVRLFWIASISLLISSVAGAVTIIITIGKLIGS